jgi:hypothetical protein
MTYLFDIKSEMAEFYEIQIRHAFSGGRLC